MKRLNRHVGIQRLEQRVLFSAISLEVSLRRAFKHLARSMEELFDFMINSRIGNELDESSNDYIATFATPCKENFCPSKVLLSFPLRVS